MILDTPFWSLTRPLFMLAHRQKYQGPGLKAFMKFCEAYFTFNKKAPFGAFYLAMSKLAFTWNTIAVTIHFGIRTIF